ncbi:MAG: SH3 domain-containing protein [archaeon]|nr:SH3 domain-containing protein [archaeon]
MASVSQDSAASEVRLVVVLWDCEALEADDLELRKGDILRVICHDPNTGFYQGEIDGRIGWFQDDYVRKPTRQETSRWLKSHPAPSPSSPQNTPPSSPSTSLDPAQQRSQPISTCVFSFQTFSL